MCTFYLNHLAILCEFNLLLLHKTVFSYMGCKCNTLETAKFLFFVNYIFSWAHILHLKQHILPSANKLWFSYPVQEMFHCITHWFWKPSSFPLTPFLSGLMQHCILLDGIWKWTLQIFSSLHYWRSYQTIYWVPELLIKHWKTKSCL